MTRKRLLLIIVLTVLANCSTVNKDPDILLKEPYTKVSYLAGVSETSPVVEVIQVTTRGSRANILSTLPQLYAKALDWSGQKNVTIGNLQIFSFSNREAVEVSHWRCRLVPVTVLLPSQSCLANGCKTVQIKQTQSEQQCQFETRIEIQDVPYQKAVANVLLDKTEK